MTTITVQVPRPVASPRGAAWAARMFERLNDALSGWQAFHGARTARRQAAARQGEAASVRRYAQAVAQYDARFAADLLAAADRHESAAK